MPCSGISCQQKSTILQGKHVDSSTDLQLQHDISTSSCWAVGCRGCKKSSQHRIDNLLRHVVYIDRCVFNLLSLVVSFVNVFDCFDIWCLNRPETWKLNKHSTLNVAMNGAGACWYQFFDIHNFFVVYRVRIAFLPPVRFWSFTCFVRRFRSPPTFVWSINRTWHATEVNYTRKFKMDTENDDLEEVKKPPYIRFEYLYTDIWLMTVWGIGMHAISLDAV